jgi:hypothetical protein
MQIKHFKTDKRLWKYLALIVFVALWFIPQIPFADGYVRPGKVWVALVRAPFYHDLSWGRFFDELPGALLFLLGFSLFFGIAAAVIGWVIQCLVVIARE